MHKQATETSVLDARSALRNASLVILSYGAHESNATRLEATLRRTVEWLQGNTGGQTVVAEYAPAHFRSPNGEYNVTLHRSPHGTEGFITSCSPHSETLDAAPNWRLEVSRRLAASFELPLLPLWDLSIRNYDDHITPARRVNDVNVIAGMKVDCRHFCNPGRTLYAWLDGLLTLLEGVA